MLFSRHHNKLTQASETQSVISGRPTLKGKLYLDLVTFRDPNAPPPHLDDTRSGPASPLSSQCSFKSRSTSTSSRSSCSSPRSASSASVRSDTSERAYEEEYFFLVPIDGRAQDVGGLVHIVGSGTQDIYLTVTPGVCPMKKKSYIRRQNIGIVTGESQFLSVAALAPLCVTKENPRIDKAIYSRWKQDMITQAIRTGVLRT